MSDLRDVLSALSRLGDDDVAVLATVVRAEGSTYRRPGARMWIHPDDSFAGLISGGCLEGDLVERARSVRESGQPALVRYDATHEDDIVWGLGLGCAGIVEILLEPVSTARPGPLAWLEIWRSAGETGVIATPLDAASLGRHFGLGPGGPIEGATPPDALAEAMRAALRDGRSRLVDGPDGPVAIEVARPPLRLVIFGAGPDAVPVARLAQEQGFRVELADPRPAYAVPERFSGARVHCVPAEHAVAEVGIDAETHTLVMTHHYLHDRTILCDLLDSDAAFIGLLGPKARAEDLLADLHGKGRSFSEGQRARLHAPAGLDLGGDGPEAVALSLIGQVLAVSQSRSGGWLRDRKGPIHDPTPA